MPYRISSIKRLEAVISAQRDVMACGLDLQRVMDVTTQGALSLTAADAAVLELSEGDEMVYRAVAGGAQGMLGTRVPMHHSLAGRAVLEDRIMLAPDIECDPYANREVCRRLGVRSMICVPLRSSTGDAVGVLKVWSAQPDSFHGEDVSTLELMAGLIATATANAVAQQQLLVSEQRFRAVAEAASDGIITADASGNIMFWNPAAQRMFGWTMEEVVGKPIAMLMPTRYVDRADPERRGFDDSRMRKALEQPVVSLNAVRRDGTEFPVELSASTWAAGEQRFYTSIVRDISERKRLEAQVLRLARTDHLTGVLNRGAGEDALAREVERMRRYRRALSCVLLDIDHFKRVNDTAGHAAGDRVLRKVGELIMGRVRSTDVASRWGGEEFLLILPETTREGACELAESLRSAIESAVFEVVPRVTVSLGVAELRADEPSEQAIIRADRHLYTAKANGRNRVEG